MSIKRVVLRVSTWPSKPDRAKKLYPIYDKLFKVEYPFIVKISNGYGHSVADRLKVHPDPAPFGGIPAPTISTAFADLILLLHGKKA
ncbi:hypothetical protein Tco_0114295 [Tanacetum coccineum]